MTAPTIDTPARPPRLPCRQTPVPHASTLGWEAYAGRACYACDTPLTTVAVPCGKARGQLGVHVLDVEVWACS
ncbi:hypothetical protein [Streptomyces sp. NBC_00829]|uniref:hypothetical protein n=1 Tax=Streptomyces sp. NBC_00829 TaxID=2903679 RepID=UPI00386A0D36|nr:hypothetical protein OG293_23020 [Streptomyces sp. NBC_00829]